MSTAAGPPTIAVLDYGIGNLRSAEKALQRVGADARLVADPEEAAAAAALVLPGVGAFGRCREALAASGLDRVCVAALAGGTPLLAICVGMQLLYEGSEESPGVAGLGVLEGTVSLLPEGVRRPQMQWNRLRWDARRRAPALLEGIAGEPGTPGGDDAPWVYFVHSYAVPDGPDVVAWCDYGGRVPAVVARGPLWAVQFHPEKSAGAGLALLERFAATVPARVR